MIDQPSATCSPPPPEEALPPPGAEPPRARRLARIQFAIYLTVTLATLLFLLWPAGNKARSDQLQADSPQEKPVRLVRPGLIHIHPESPLNGKLQASLVKPTSIAAPVITVTGNVVASLRQARGGARDWQFHSPELLTAYTDWQRAVADITFAQKQLDSIRQLAENRVAAQGALVNRLKKLVEAGTDTERDLATAQTELLQARIQGRKEMHEAETAWRLARRSEAALSRQLQQGGIDADLLRVTATEIALISADVPEAMLSRVKLGQRCEARFLCLGGKVFTGIVRSISPVLSRERRSLRVLFTIDDPDDLLRPGMFADIGLGTDARDALLVPIAGVVHVGHSDFVLVQSASGDWRVTPVQVGELHGETVEILDGLKAGDRVMGQGAILLKPFMVETTRESSSPVLGS